MCGIVKLSSVRGRKRKIVVELVDWETIAIYPRKETETRSIERWCFDCLIAIYPRKGTKTSLPNHCLNKPRLQLIPARERLQVRLGVNQPLVHYNLSPQRDGNVLIRFSCPHNQNCNLSPQNPLRRCAPALPSGELFRLPFTPMLSSPFRRSWHGVSRD